jgi:ectoine hydroxylase-related dioxygenase (phytanoyl-CoA dioxygenase family)
MFTIRIHLDDTDENNGAVRVIPGSHRRGIISSGDITRNEQGVTCAVAKGGIMVMKPLLLHSSGRTVNGLRRRVIHIEFSNMELPEPLQWAERMSIPG